MTFHDLRGTAVTRLATTGCTTAEIASLTGHSLRDVNSILDAHYLHRDPARPRAESQLDEEHKPQNSPTDSELNKDNTTTTKRPGIKQSRTRPDPATTVQTNTAGMSAAGES